MTRRQKSLLLATCLLAVWAIAAQTLINLTSQVTGLLPITNGGTNASSAATAFANLAQTPTSPLTESAGVYACPTCTTGPNTTIVGGIVGAGVFAVGSNITYCWFCYQTGQTFSTLSTDIWLGNLTAAIAGSMGVGSYYSVGYVSYQGATGYPGNQQFTINSAATAAAYQSPYPFYQFVNSAKSSINISAISPTGSAAASMTMVTAAVLGQNVQPLRWGTNGITVPLSASLFAGPGQSQNGSATESLMVTPFSTPGTISDLCFTTTGAQPASGTLVVTFRYGATFGAIANSTLTQTIPVSGGAGTYCDHNPAHNVTVVAGGVFTFGMVNAATAVSATINGFSVLFTPSGAGATAMVIFPSGTQAFTSGSSQYASGIVSQTFNTTEANMTFGMPRPAVMKNFYCYNTTAPGTNSHTITVRQNSASPASGLAITLTTSTTGITSDTSHTISFANKDLVDLQHAQSSGTGPAISACSMEID